MGRQNVYMEKQPQNDICFSIFSIFATIFIRFPWGGIKPPFTSRRTCTKKQLRKTTMQLRPSCSRSLSSFQLPATPFRPRSSCRTLFEFNPRVRVAMLREAVRYSLCSRVRSPPFMDFRSGLGLRRLAALETEYSARLGN